MKITHYGNRTKIKMEISTGKVIAWLVEGELFDAYYNGGETIFPDDKAWGEIKGILQTVGKN